MNQHARSALAGEMKYLSYKITLLEVPYYLLYIIFFSRVKNIRRQSVNNRNGKKYKNDINADALQCDECVFKILKLPDSATHVYFLRIYSGGRNRFLTKKYEK